MTPSVDTRRALYRRGKRLLGERRMARLRESGRRATRDARALRTRLERLRERSRRGPWARVDVATALDARHVLIAGRIDAGPDARVRLVVDDGTSIDASPALRRYVDRPAARTRGRTRGFVLSCAIGEGTRVLSLSVSAEGAPSCTRRVPVADERSDALARVARLLDLLDGCASDRRALLDDALGEAIGRAWASRPRFDARARADIVRYNPALAVSRPRVSIVVPLYGRHDFLAHQLTAFSQDPSLRDAELLYVVDDPRLDEGVRRDAAALARLHDIAFSVIHLGCNLGYAGANNAAAGFARADQLLLLNSDVLPIAPGWLDRLLAAAGRGRGDRIVGARLLYHDGSIQHDGMRFERAPHLDGLWINRHPGKGLPRGLVPAGETASREAVTGACLLVPRRRYAELGGLDEDYVLGDFEDSDLCLRARRAGLEIVLETDVELHHLERQSQSLVTSDVWKRHLTHYNCWLHTRRWDDDIAALQTGGATGCRSRG